MHNSVMSGMLQQHTGIMCSQLSRRAGYSRESVPGGTRPYIVRAGAVTQLVR